MPVFLIVIPNQGFIAYHQPTRADTVLGMRAILVFRCSSRGPLLASADIVIRGTRRVSDKPTLTIL